MTAPKIKRWIDQDRFEAARDDLRKIAKRVAASRGELDLRLRDNYFNLYYKGNSMAKVSLLRKGYRLSIHRKFTVEADKAKDTSELKGYSTTPVISGEELNTQLSTARLARIASRIKKENWGEEVTFEQMLITDNPPSPEFMIIDRQVTGGALGRSRLDLLALRRADGDSHQYEFVILEVKLGNNPELQGDVLTEQLRPYIRTLTNDLSSFARCYEEAYRQTHSMGLLCNKMPAEITITGPVKGMIVVGGYSGMAADAISKLQSLKKSEPDPIDEQVTIWRQPCLLTEGIKPL